MIIVGLHIGHDASIAIIRDGILIGTTAMERLSRVKKASRIEKEQLELFLGNWGYTINDVDHFSISTWTKDLVSWLDIYSPYEQRYPLSTFGTWKKETPILNHFDDEYSERVEKTEWGFTLPNIIHRVCEPYTSDDIEIETRFEINIRIEGYDKTWKGWFIDHHLAHAASTYFTSDFDQAAVFTVDASMHHAEACSGYYIARGNLIQPFRNPGYMLGNFYDVATEHLGIGPGTTKAGSMMGLAAYGRIKRKAYDKWKEWTAPLNERKWERVEHRFTDWLFMQISGRYPMPLREQRPEIVNEQPGWWHFNRGWQYPYTKAESETQEGMDIAATIQFITERSLVQYSQDLYEETKTENGGNLCVAGGTFLNCNANYKIQTETDFDRMHMFPACGDDGTAAGSALYVTHALQDWPRQKYSTADLAYTGITWINYEESLPPNAKDLDLDIIADYLNDDKIICWYDGRSENGPRALGHRSFIASPKNPKMKDILNSRVKFREWYRPFAPIVLQEKAQDWFVMDFDSPYMLHTVPCKRPFEIPSAVHIDNTARVQTLTKEHNEKLYTLIEKFEERSGIPIIINTSLNVKGEPIVETPDDVLKLFRESDVDVLVINNQMWVKNE